MPAKQYKSDRSILKNSIINMGGMVLPMFIGIVCIRFALQGLGEARFGILSITWAILSYIMLLDFGLSRATTKYVSEYIEVKQLNKIGRIFWSALSISFTIGVIASIVFYFISPLIVFRVLNIDILFQQETLKAFRYFTVALPFLLMTTSLKGTLNGVRRFDIVNAIHVPTTSLNFIFPALSLPFNFGLDKIILFILISRIVATILYFYRNVKVFGHQLIKPSIDISTIKSVLFYGGWVTITSVVSPILVYIDRFFIGSQLGMEAVTFYTPPTEIVNRLRIFPVALMATLFPEYSPHHASGNVNQLIKHYGRSVKYVLIAMGFLASFCFIYSYDLLSVWLGEDIAIKSFRILQIFSVGLLINALAYIPFSYLQSIGRPEIPARFHLLELPVYILLLYFFIQQWGLIGIALAWLLRILIDAALLFIFSVRITKQLMATYINKYLILAFTQTIGLSGIFYTINRYLSQPNLKLLSALIFVLFYIIISWRFLFDEFDKSVVYKIIGKVKR